MLTYLSISLDQGFPNSFTKSPPFQKFEKKSPPIILYSNFPLDGALFSQKSCIRNFILDYFSNACTFGLFLNWFTGL